MLRLNALRKHKLDRSWLRNTTSPQAILLDKEVFKWKYGFIEDGQHKKGQDQLLGETLPGTVKILTVKFLKDRKSSWQDLAATALPSAE